MRPEGISGPSSRIMSDGYVVNVASGRVPFRSGGRNVGSHVVIRVPCVKPERDDWSLRNQFRLGDALTRM